MSPDQLLALGLALGIVLGVAIVAVTAPELLTEWFAAWTRRDP